MIRESRHVRAGHCPLPEQALPRGCGSRHCTAVASDSDSDQTLLPWSSWVRWVSGLLPLSSQLLAPCSLWGRDVDRSDLFKDKCKWDLSELGGKETVANTFNDRSDENSEIVQEIQIIFIIYLLSNYMHTTVSLNWSSPNLGSGGSHGRCAVILCTSHPVLACLN